MIFEPADKILQRLQLAFVEPVHVADFEALLALNFESNALAATFSSSSSEEGITSVRSKARSKQKVLRSSSGSCRCSR